jgi:hypothetical protein
LFLQKVGLISNLELQKPFVICDQFFSKSTNSIVKPIKYVCDFFYFDKDLGGWVIEDVKGFKTDVYNLKKKLLLKKLNDSDSGDTIIFKES